MKTKMIFAVLMSALTMFTTKTYAAEEIATSKKQTFYYLNEMDESIKFEYSLNEDGKVVSKVGFVKDEENNRWMPRTAYYVVYGDKETTVTCARWNERTKTFTSKAKQQKFCPTSYPEVIKMPR